MRRMAICISPLKMCVCPRAILFLAKDVVSKYHRDVSDQAEERALELMCKRALTRTAFGKPLAELGGNYDVIADSRIEIDQCRLAVLKAAHMMDEIGNKEARKYISAIKVSVPNMALRVIDRAIQMYGALGVSQDTPLAGMWMGQRTLRLADGPDEVHRRVIAREELKQYS